MAKFDPIEYEKLGEFIYKLVNDDALIAKFKSGDQDLIKGYLKAFMTPKGLGWDQLTIVPHFDGATTVNIAFPYKGDVEETVKAIAPAVGPGEDYPFPDFYAKDPNAGATDEEKKQNRLRSYYSRLGDYVMTRCK